MPTHRYRSSSFEQMKSDIIDFHEQFTFLKNVGLQFSSINIITFCMQVLQVSVENDAFPHNQLVIIT